MARECQGYVAEEHLTERVPPSPWNVLQHLPRRTVCTSRLPPPALATRLFSAPFLDPSTHSGAACRRFPALRLCLPETMVPLRPLTLLQPVIQARK